MIECLRHTMSMRHSDWIHETLDYIKDELKTNVTLTKLSMLSWSSFSVVVWILYVCIICEN